MSEILFKVRRLFWVCRWRGGLGGCDDDGAQIIAIFARIMLGSIILRKMLTP